MEESLFPQAAAILGRVCIMRLRLLVVALLAFSATTPLQAGIFRTKKPDPTIHVPELITALKTDKDERVRANAAAELRDYDGKTFPDILPTLIDALGNDASPLVRAEAAESIGAVRPITNKAGYALEQALANDKSMLVRISVRMALSRYRFLGFIGVSKADLPMAQTKEPPLAKPTTLMPTVGSPVIRPIPSTTTPGTTPPPPTIPPSSNVRVMPAKRPPDDPPVGPSVPKPEVIPVPTPTPVIVVPSETPKVPETLPLPPVPPVPPVPIGPKLEGPSLGTPPKL